jgi:uncharacterized protein YjbJ (UPF0337 family)
LSLKDKVSNKYQSTKGKAKEKIGKASNDKSLKRKGQADQIKASVKNTVEKAKDLASDAKKSAEEK